MLFTTQTAARAFQPRPPVRTPAPAMRENHDEPGTDGQAAARRRFRFALVLAATK